jgi:hypothetical protein
MDDAFHSSLGAAADIPLPLVGGNLAMETVHIALKIKIMNRCDAAHYACPDKMIR